MKYAVIWVPAAEQALAALWLNTSQRAAITAAAHVIDKELAKDPNSAGESRADEFRILLAAPLGVRFLVKEDEKRVYVLAVWSFQRRPRA